MMKMKAISGSQSRGQCRGFSLIEALVALLVLAIGLLAVAGMQLKALQGAHMAYQRSLANVIAIDAQERLWSKLEPNTPCPSADKVSTAWKTAWFTNNDRETLPGDGGASEIKGGECSYTIIVDWSEERLMDAGKEVGLSSFTYELRLPDI